MAPSHTAARFESTLPQPFNEKQECIKDESFGEFPRVGQLCEDLSVADLNAVHAYLSIAGSLDHYNPLHHQLVLNREIKASEQMRLHMLWMGRVIYIKPLPHCLMNAAYVRDSVCENQELHQLAIGFLLSYCKMIRSPLDIDVAHSHSLLPKEVTWGKWKPFRQEILSALDGNEKSVNIRYKYGEIRISRLNLIYRLTGRGMVYFTTHRGYGTYFADYFQLFITIFAFASTVLQAMQVALSGNRYPKSFDQASYVISLVTIFGVALSILIVGGLFLSLFVANAYITARAQHRARRTEQRAAARGLLH